MDDNDERIVPDTLYKYRSLEGTALANSLSIISKNEVYFSRPEELNDPFECQARVDTSTLRAQFSELKHEDVELEEAIRRDWRRKLRVFCLCEMFSNQLMWSHYADNHRGICIGFSTTQMGNLEPVEYVSEMRIIDGNNAESIYKSLALTKSKHWEYEREWRSVNFDEAQLIPLPHDCVVEVTLGCEISMERSQQVVRDLLLRSIKHKPTKLYRALRNRKDYSIERYELGVADGRFAVDSMGTLDLEAMIDRALELLA